MYWERENLDIDLGIETEDVIEDSEEVNTLYNTPTPSVRHSVLAHHSVTGFHHIVRHYSFKSFKYAATYFSKIHC